MSTLGGTALLARLERDGILLVHDQRLPSASSIIAGEPVAGSWWSHPLANDIYDALQPLARVATSVKLVAEKETFVHRRLWPELVALGLSGQGWQVDGLSDQAVQLMAAVRRARSPRTASDLDPSLDRKTRQRVVREVEVRLLVQTDELHTTSGAHAKHLRSWKSFAREHGITPTGDEARARSTFESITSAWPARSPLFPWQHSRRR